MRQLSLFPLDQHAMVADLEDNLKKLLSSYIEQRFPGSPELTCMFEAVWTRYPKYLRVKELFETVEVSGFNLAKPTRITRVLCFNHCRLSKK